MSETGDQVTTVTIADQKYQIRSGGDPDHVRRLASYVDERMNEVFEWTPTVDTLKVAVLTALNIADEYFSAQQELKDLERSVLEKSERMMALLEDRVGSESA